MPAPRKELPEDSENGYTILRKSIPVHMKLGGLHSRNYAQLEKVRVEEQVTKERADARYNQVNPATLASSGLPSIPTASSSTHALPESYSVDINGLFDSDFMFQTTSEPFLVSGGEARDRDILAARQQAELQSYGLRFCCPLPDDNGEANTDDDASLPQSGNQNDSNDLEEDIDLADLQNYLSFGRTCDWAPYMNKTICLLDVLDNLPRLRMSDAQLRILLWVMKEVGCQDVPSFYTLRKVQNNLRSKLAVPTMEFKSSLGNVFYTNDICESIAKDFSNPLVAEHMVFYPEEGDMPISEIWQCSRWKELPLHLHSPMYAKQNTHFYVNELAQLRNGTLVIPIMWFTNMGVVYAHALMVKKEQEELVVQDGAIDVAVDDFKYCYSDLQGAICTTFSSGSSEYAAKIPNPYREKAKGLPLYAVNVNMWADDVSGNVSKQYNKHINFYMANTNIPGQLLQQEYFVRFVSTSPFASSLEQFAAIKKQVDSSRKNPITAFNAYTQEPCKFMLNIPALPADNPQQSEECSHSGGNSNLLCRRCGAGGTNIEKETPEGYHRLHKCGTPRTVAATKEAIEAQLEAAMRGKTDSHISTLQTGTGIKDRMAQIWIDKLVARAKMIRSKSPLISEEELLVMQKKWLNEKTGSPYNPLLDLEGLDPHCDTPVEILHTVLLGIVKYVWHMLHTSWSDQQRTLFASRLQSTDTSGLNLTGNIRAHYMMQYRNGLIGKHFKILMQTMVFHLHGLTTPAQFQLAKATGELSAMLWYHEIKDMKQYLVDLEQLVDNILDSFDDCDPARIITKVKLHILPHIVEDIPRFGPAIHFSTEVFESYNAIFRMCSVLSNHQAPSHDIAIKFSHMDRIKHIMSGGYWKEAGEWVQAGPEVIKLLQDNNIFQRHIGWVPKPSFKRGTITLKSKEKPPPQALIGILAAKGFHIKDTGPIDKAWLNSDWELGQSVMSEQGEGCRLGAWVFYRSKTTFCIGRILEIASQTKGEKGVVLMNKFVLGDSLHEEFKLPIVTQQNDAEVFGIVDSLSIYCIANIQHDCRSGDCQLTTPRVEYQEHKATSRENMALTHSDSARFLLNLHALHNASLHRDILPRHLTAPVPLVQKEDCIARHTELSTQLQVTQGKKRAETAVKRKTANAAKKAQKTTEVSAGGLQMEYPGGLQAEGNQVETSSSSAGPLRSGGIASKKRKPGSLDSITQPERTEKQTGESS
ncbi:hypothetical protein DFH11DRAFT_1545899 [Phellopilus nigrolimitatus]|nr:hypothetical protein DFH11DRAFT_1545899 [Phellopilus nigrolimitatus]